jgi:hypothetical protein
MCGEEIFGEMKGKRGDTGKGKLVTGLALSKKEEKNGTDYP